MTQGAQYRLYSTLYFSSVFGLHQLFTLAPTFTFFETMTKASIGHLLKHNPISTNWEATMTCLGAGLSDAAYQDEGGVSPVTAARKRKPQRRASGLFQHDTFTSFSRAHFSTLWRGPALRLRTAGVEPLNRTWSTSFNSKNHLMHRFIGINVVMSSLH